MTKRRYSKKAEAFAKLVCKKIQTLPSKNIEGLTLRQLIQVSDREMATAVWLASKEMALPVEYEQWHGVIERFNRLDGEKTEVTTHDGHTD